MPSRERCDPSLARDTEAPYVDARANLGDGLETRYYVAQLLEKDQLVGRYPMCW